MGSADVYSKMQHLLMLSTTLHKHSVLPRSVDRGTDWKGGSGISQCGTAELSAEAPPPADAQQVEVDVDILRAGSACSLEVLHAQACCSRCSPADALHCLSSSCAVRCRCLAAAGPRSCRPLEQWPGMCCCGCFHEMTARKATGTWVSRATMTKCCPHQQIVSLPLSAPVALVWTLMRLRRRRAGITRQCPLLTCWRQRTTSTLPLPATATCCTSGASRPSRESGCCCMPFIVDP